MRVKKMTNIRYAQVLGKPGHKRLVRVRIRAGAEARDNGEGRETGGRAEKRRSGQPLHQERRVLGFQVGFELLVGVVLMIIFNSVSCTF